MRATSSANKRLPRRFDDLVRLMAPQAIMDDVHYENTLEMIDRLMASGKLSKGQELYLETLVQLVQTYEARQHAIDTADLGGVAALRHLLEASNMNASDLARLLGLHQTMGSKILAGDRALTVGHMVKLAERFGVPAELFMPRKTQA
jgi:HTH-type transcriptional regulator/antitoxin HigA